MSTRALAAKTLAPVLLQKQSLDSAIANRLPSIAANDRALYKALCYGVCRHFFSLDAIYEEALNKPLKNKDADVRALILLGLYQLLHLRVPDHAAINETVNGAKSLGKHWAVKLVNGVLRNAMRNRELLTTKSHSSLEHPAWLAERIQHAWPVQWRDIVDNNNRQAPMTLRVNRAKTTRDSYREDLEKQGFSSELCQFSEDGLILNEAADVDLLPGFADGYCSVQDEAAQLAASLLALKDAKHILDACCAPGGKTCHIAEHMNQDACLTALDIDKGRLQRVEQNLQRLQLQANLVASPAQDIETWWNGQLFDRILLDAPCSATGVIRRHPDIKLLRRDSDIGELGELQSLILQRLWECLAPGGLLVYATCSVLPEENEKVVAKFVETQADAIHLAIDASWGIARPVGRQLFPKHNGHDGFYYACIRKG